MSKISAAAKNANGFEGTVIVAFGRGKVVLCHGKDTEYVDDGTVNWVRIKKGWTVRNWGTEHGLGELSTNGPTSNTILDAIPHGILVPTAALHGMWICTEQSIKGFVGPCDKSDQQLLK